MRKPNYLVNTNKVNHPKLAFMAALFAVLQVAHAGFTTNDLYLGFTQDTAQSDYIIDLGQPAVIGVGGSSVVDLSSHFSLTTFNSVFTGGPVGVNSAVVAGNNTFSQYDVYATQVRTNGAGTPGVPGSSITAGHSSSQMSGGAAEVAAIMSSVIGGLPTAGNSALDSTKSYTSIVMTTGVQNNFIGKTGVVPLGTFDTSKILYLDLYKATVATAYTYLGFFTLDLSTGTPHLTFTPSGAVGTVPPSYELGIAHKGTTNTISFAAANGFSYQVIYTNASGIKAPRSTWPTLGSPIGGTGANANYIDVTTDPSRFYSIRAQ